jgi:hypothetical protein
MLRIVRIVTFVVAAVSAAWAIRLEVLGGIHLVAFGHLIRSNSLFQPLAWALGSVVVFVIAGGVPAVGRAWRRVARRVEARPVMPGIPAILFLYVDRLGRFLSAPGMALALAAVIFATGAAYGTTVASGADASGYVSQADRWIHGPLKPPQPWVGQVPWPNPRWTFTPLGYRPVDDAPPYAQAPIYSPGLPLMMAAAKIIGGQAALFLVVPLCAAVMVLATFGVARRLRGPTAGVTAAWLVATSPIVIWMLVFPMSDLPVAAAWTAALFFLIGEGAGSILTAGILSAVAVLIRPNLFFLAPIMSLWFFVRDQKPSPSFARRLRDAALFYAGVAPGAIFIGGLFAFLFGSPWVSGYGRLSEVLDAANVWPNMRLYFQWALSVQATFTIIGLLGLVMPFLWPRGHARRAVAIVALMVLGITAEYVAYTVFDDWAFLRFFLPAWPLLAIGGAGVVAALLDRTPSALKVAVVAGVIGLGVAGVRTVRDRFVFDLWYYNRRYTAASVIIRDVSAPNSVVFSMEQSGALRYYSGRVPLRYDQLPPDWLDRSVDWLAGSGVHCYAVLDAWEIEPFRARFRGQQRVRGLDTPIVLYQSFGQGTVVYVYDLTTPPPAGARPTIITETDPSRWRDWPPGPEPTLVFKRAGSPE